MYFHFSLSTNEFHIKFHIKHFKTLQRVSILSDHHQGALFLAKVILQYSQFNSYLQTRCCGSISCCVGMCCGAVARCASYDAHLATVAQHIPTQHDMLPQHLVCKYELNCEYCNITLARNKAPWWWSDKIETCPSILTLWRLTTTIVRRTPSHCSTTHSHTTWYAATTPRLQIRIECEYRNITLARNKAPWWWSDKIETCRSVLKCFM